MSTLNSLLMLQGEEVKDPLAVAALKDSSMRIRTIIELYDELFKSKDFTNISVQEYLSSLVNEILASHPGGNTVRVSIEICELFLDVKILHPLGIIVNEIITNIMKYAFTNTDNPSLDISLDKNVKNIILTIQDNGCGLPENFSLENQTGFGLKLISMLTYQLQGEFKMENNKGTRVVLTFPL